MKVPQWSEFSIQNMWEEVKDVPEFLPYVPDTWSCEGHRKPEKRFFFALISTMYSEWLRQAVIDCSQQRHSDKEASIYEPKKL